MNHDILTIEATDIDLDTVLPQSVLVGSTEIAWLTTVGEALDFLSGLMVADPQRGWRAVYAGLVAAIETGSGRELSAATSRLRDLAREIA